MESTSEKAFADLWERALELRPSIVDREGRLYEVVFPGIRNTGPGPDFTGAVLIRDGRRFGGDVELHLDPSGWRGHGHHTDGAYNGVVLQVVMRMGARNSAHPSPPTARAVFPSTEPDTRPPCSRLETDAIRQLGIERFVAKSAGFRLELEAGVNAEQLMYRAVMECLGYTRNRTPFLELSKSVPVSQFDTLRSEPASSAQFAVLSALAVSGGLTEETDRAESVQMRRVARTLGIRRSVIPASSWSRFRVRPNGRPLNRMRGMALLLGSRIGMGLSRSMESVVSQSGTTGLLDEIRQNNFIGRGLTLTIIANAILPSLHAAEMPHDGNSALSAFMNLPTPPPDSVTRGVSKSFGIERSPRSAVEHFGLHALARSASWPAPAEISPAPAVSAAAAPR